MKVFIYNNGHNLKNYINVCKEFKHKVVFSKNIKKSKNCDALILTGGGDVAPFLYNHNVSKSDRVNLFCDIDELNLIRQFVSNNKKILGICKGMQLLNVYFNGTLHKKIPYHSNSHHDIYHTVLIDENCPFYNIFSSKIITNSAHIQAVKKLGDNFEIFGRSCDNVIEIIQHAKLPILATQFHPERLNPTFKKAFFNYFFNIL